VRFAKLTFLVLILFGAGFVAGMAYSRVEMKKRMERMGRGEMDAEHMIRRFSKALNLSEEQKKIIKIKLSGRQVEWSRQRQEMRDRLKAQTQEFLNEIAVDLNSEQREKLSRFQTRMIHREKREKRGSEPKVEDLTP
jgi:predicted butyrate kinase (DUF1464 family)